jgi:hypothetical protein
VIDGKLDKGSRKLDARIAAKCRVDLVQHYLGMKLGKRSNGTRSSGGHVDRVHVASPKVYRNYLGIRSVLRQFPVRRDHCSIAARSKWSGSVEGAS